MVPQGAAGTGNRGMPAEGGAVVLWCTGMCSEPCTVRVGGGIRHKGLQQHGSRCMSRGGGSGAWACRTPYGQHNGAMPIPTLHPPFPPTSLLHSPSCLQDHTMALCQPPPGVDEPSSARPWLPTTHTCLFPHPQLVLHVRAHPCHAALTTPRSTPAGPHGCGVPLYACTLPCTTLRQPLSPPVCALTGPHNGAVRMGHPALLRSHTQW